MSAFVPWQLDFVFGCMLHQPTDSEGYGRIGRRLAHVIAFEAAHGPIAEGMFVDHLCRRRNCVALYHLELVTQSENEKRKNWKHRARRELCPVGHELKLNAIVTPEGGRVCRACNRAAAKGA